MEIFGRLRLISRALSFGGLRAISVKIRTAQIEAALFANKFAAVPVQFARAVRAD
jgi:hypothetical protein